MDGDPPEGGPLTPQQAERLFDRGVALWNARDPHPAHEEWEALWHEAEGPRRAWLQGLIQVAAALFHVERGFYASGFVKLMRSAAEKRRGYDARGERIDAAALEADLGPWEAHAELVERGRGLREQLPPWPTIRYRAGRAPPAAPPSAGPVDTTFPHETFGRD